MVDIKTGQLGSSLPCKLNVLFNLNVNQKLMQVTVCANLDSDLD